MHEPQLRKQNAKILSQPVDCPAMDPALPEVYGEVSSGLGLQPVLLCVAAGLQAGPLLSGSWRKG